MGNKIATEDGTCEHSGSGSQAGTLSVAQNFVKIENKKIMSNPDTMEVPSHVYDPAPLSHSHSYIPDSVTHTFVKIEGSAINCKDDFYSDDFTIIDSSGQDFVLIEGQPFSQSLFIQRSFVRSVTGNIYNGIGTDWMTGGVGGDFDFSSIVESGNILGNFTVTGEVFLDDISCYPTTFEWQQLNNNNGYTGAFKPTSGTWVEGWNKAYINPINNGNAHLANWSDFRRLEIYANSSNGKTFTFGLRNFKINK